LKPLKDIYLDTNDLSGFFFKRGGSVTFLLTIFTILSSFILLVACINFMNLSTAHATNRAMEVGLRKTIGGQRKQLIMQFLGETLLYSYIAIILAIGLLEVCLPLFINFTGLELKINLFNNFNLIAAMLGIATITGLIAGIYPAILISGYQPAKVIKGYITGGSQTKLRKGLIIFQLLISILFIFGTITIFKQVEFLKNKEIGFDKEHVVILPIKDNTIRYKYDVIKHELLKDSRILNVTASSQVPFMNSQNSIQLKSEDIDDVNLGIIYIHYDYLETLRSSLIDGRLPDQTISTDTDQAILMNQTACRKLNWQTPVGKNVNLFITEKDRPVPLYNGKIIGVVKDYIFRDFRQPVQPLLFKIDKNRIGYMLIRIDGNQFQSALETIKSVLYTFAPDQPFDIHFLEDKVEQSYLFFQNHGKMVLFFSVITILLSCLGLFGLAIYDTKRKIKEIGVRKIHGASIIQILGLLSKKYLVLVGIGNILSLPIAYILMNKMLQLFVYRTAVGLDVFLFSIMVSVMIVIVSVGWQAIRAATANPVEALRYE
jgi:ABC-type antimicrobial peptide transport system permease subunit